MIRYNFDNDLTKFWEKINNNSTNREKIDKIRSFDINSRTNWEHFDNKWKKTDNRSITLCRIMYFSSQNNLRLREYFSPILLAIDIIW